MTLHVVTFHSTFLLVRTLHQSEPSVECFVLTLTLFTQKVTHPITTLSQVCLTTKFLSDRLPKSKCILLLLDLSHSGVIQLGYYMPTSFCLVHPRTTPYWEREPFVGSLFQDLENQLCLLLGSMTDPTNQHKTFQRGFVLTHTFFQKNFLEVTISITTPSQVCLTMTFLSDGLPKSRCILLV
ncbi:hypothetical protein GmHk_16G046092 [Glycine max]|nr:hypothetical protein GmHk_16G046092 [Glycine max]